MRIFSGASSDPSSVPAVACETRYWRSAIIHGTLRAQDVAFCEFLCGGSDAVFVAEQPASFRHSRSHTGWF